VLEVATDDDDDTNMSLNCGHEQAYCSSLRYRNMENRSGMISTG
jgi:hypothetical protein